MNLIKLEGENIVGHVSTLHPNINPEEYDAAVEVDVLVDFETGHYIYKYVSNELVSLSEEEINVIKVMTGKEKTISDAYNVMNAEVYAQMELVFGTKNADSASAYERTWTLMKTNPGSFINAGVENDAGVEFTVEQEVINYADDKITQVLSYGVWRMARIAQFRNLRTSILAE